MLISVRNTPKDASKTILIEILVAHTSVKLKLTNILMWPFFKV